eukprot:TRINITY_DN6487_c1_g2_i4.p1 TRINITY_DN6487_c1_g2~~TRINITY_DN6487_c1_g2_i4.p1  ORF type:complete len:100 (-),score=18.80 TRINITY_DN6487_c1_g2_i4:682-981(-)
MHNVLTPEECQQYIDLSEKMGYEPSPLRSLDTVNSTVFNRDEGVCGFLSLSPFSSPHLSPLLSLLSSLLFPLIFTCLELTDRLDKNKCSCVIRCTRPHW